VEHVVDVGNRPEPSSNGKGHEALVRCPGNDVVHDVAVFGRGVDVKENQFVSPLPFIGFGGFYRIPGVDQVFEINAFDNPSVRYVKAGDEPNGEHGQEKPGQASSE
jgi:hypothetical protein